MMRQIIISVLFLNLYYFVSAQELFPLNEPASNMPKGVLGVRVFTNSYMEYDVLRNMSGVRLMYGVSPRLTLIANLTTSNHHGVDLPPNLVSHTHVGNQTLYYIPTFQRGISYPYIFNGVDLYAKFRFLSIDGIKTHFRAAAYAEWSNVSVAHDEAEPNLMDDTGGYGSGLILTYLKNHFAVSAVSGIVIPNSYSGTSLLSSGQDVPITIEYGRAITYNLSFGYLLFPQHYSSYKQVNVNVYAEFIGKSYEGAKVYQFGIEVPVETVLLKAGNYVDVNPALQYDVPQS